MEPAFIYRFSALQPSGSVLVHSNVLVLILYVLTLFDAVMGLSTSKNNNNKPAAAQPALYVEAGRDIGRGTL
ncbi:hypothetical protein BDN67DRAFT_1018031 [Paxillus ammoniavirescens]|nr:hypothetical protein BDN67DRAFT_1018031 [Paxillus ammoniavirescens]